MPSEGIEGVHIKRVIISHLSCEGVTSHCDTRTRTGKEHLREVWHCHVKVADLGECTYCIRMQMGCHYTNCITLWL